VKTFVASKTSAGLKKCAIFSGTELELDTYLLYAAAEENEATYAELPKHCSCTASDRRPRSMVRYWRMFRDWKSSRAFRPNDAARS
jgi:hypothetical protein